MGRLQLKNVCIKKGRPYFRRQVAGRDTYIPLPDIDSPEFADTYARLMAPSALPEAPVPGSFAALVALFRASPEYKGTNDTTRTNRARYLDMIVEGHGKRSVRGVRPVHVYKMRDDLADTPGKANNYVATMRLLMQFAMRLDWRSDNPALKIPALEIGEHEPWPGVLIEAALRVATPMTRLAIVTGLCSGQRISDCILMGHNWHDGEIMQLSQKKTKVFAAIPMHPLWLEEIARHKRRATTILYDRFGRPFQSTGTLQSRVRDLMKDDEVKAVIRSLVETKAIEPGQTFSFHGLRKNACCYLLEMGMSDTTVGSILGMSPEMVRHYGKRAKALMIARGAANQIMSSKIIPIKAGNSRLTRSGTA